MSIQLSEITIYPIKSCGGISLLATQLESRGPRFDRRWMIVDDDGMFMTQRDYPRLTLVSVTLDSDCLRLSAPGMPALQVPLTPEPSKHIPVVVWDDNVEALTVDKSTEWFSEFLGKSCKLVAMSEQSVRPVVPEYSVSDDQVSFADGFPMLLISEASLAELNKRLIAPVSMRRFRPNLVVKGCEPFAEDFWKEIEIGNVRMHVVKPCARCTIPTVDLVSGEKGPEPLRTLATFRTVGHQVLFGQNVIHVDNGEVHVGNEVRVLR